MLSPVHIIVVLAVSSFAQGQWVNDRAAGVPRTANGKPNLKAPIPRLNGKPDFSGIWHADEAAPGEIEKVIPGLGLNAVPGDDPTTFPKYFFNALSDYKEGEIKLSAEAEKLWQQNLATGDLGYRCLPASLPMIDLLPSQRRMVQNRSLLVILYEGDIPRQIHLDGRALPVNPQQAWVGYSVGKWDGDTLEVETMGVQERAPIDGLGHPRSDESRMTERMLRLDYGHMEVQVTIRDPKYYSKPIQFKYTQTLVPDDDLLEWVCNENEKDAAHISQR